MDITRLYLVSFQLFFVYSSLTFVLGRTAVVTPATAGYAVGGGHRLEPEIQVIYSTGNDDSDNDLFQHGFLLSNISTTTIKLLV